MWFDKTKVKENKVVVKLYDENRHFRKSVIMPTVMYPLNDNNIKVFHCDNTDFVTDKHLLDLIDTVPYKIGFCYENTSHILDVLNSHGYEAKSYVGWLFVDDTQFPIHHCWTVVNDNQIIDLADDLKQMLNEQNAQKFKDVNMDIGESRKLLASFAESSRKYKNSVRCYPIGKASPIYYYVGTECNPDKGRKIYQNLIKAYPHHECQRNVNKQGMNITQILLKEKGLID